jgi:hypothetical protein
VEYELGRVSIYHQLPSDKPTLQLLEYITNEAVTHAGWSITIYRDDYSNVYTLSPTGNWLDSNGINLIDVDEDLVLYGHVVELKDQFGTQQRFKVCVEEIINSWEHPISFDCLRESSDSTTNNVFGNTIFYRQDTTVLQDISRSFEAEFYWVNINVLLRDWFSKTLDENSGCYIDPNIYQFQMKLFVNGTQHDYEVGFIQTSSGLKRTIFNIDPCRINPIISQHPFSLHLSDNIVFNCSKPCEFYLGYNKSN